jgi:hypothetical protein
MLTGDVDWQAALERARLLRHAAEKKHVVKRLLRDLRQIGQELRKLRPPDEE